jgi:hypothetical protein
MIAANDNIERLGEEIGALVEERQSLRAVAADSDVLERNRLEICRLQRRLAQALIARYLPEQAEAA